ncbi:hypothetical protein J9K13_002756 [Salmonella enterica]|nr:hypothetical protein [Salmonella enterica]HEC8456418.1 hypothetical protein [Salmonella enterica subsp. enterica serovar Poona]
MKRIFIFLLLSSALSGCSVHKDMIPVGGSKADGTVKLAYEYGILREPEVSMQQGVEAATRKCQSWGYKEAEPFGGSEQTCIASGQYGCMRYRVTTEFQCIN